MIEPEVLVDKLNGLGTVDAVRKFLVEQGVKGTPCNGVDCIVANYIRRESGLRGRVFRDLIVGVRIYHLKFHVREFINRFDNGTYPELISPDLP
jgi:hypothetical protein